MACPVSTLLTNAAANGYFGLDDRSIHLCLVAVLLPGAGNPSASTVMTNGKGFQAYDDRQLDEALGAHLCELLGS